MESDGFSYKLALPLLQFHHVDTNLLGCHKAILRVWNLNLLRNSIF